MDKKETQQIPYKSKVAYELVFLEAIKDMRKQRVNNPGHEFINAILALELVLLPKEREDVEAYKLDYSEYKEELETLEKEVSAIQNKDMQRKVRINRLKKISWLVYCNELDKLYEEKKIEDQDFDGVADKNDLIILKYNGLAEKIIEVLKDNDWLIKGSDMIVGGGGHGLEGYEDR